MSANQQMLIAAQIAGGGGGFTQMQTQGNDTDQNHVGDSSTLHLASSFTAVSAYSVAKAKVRLKKNGTPTFTLIAKLYTNGTGPDSQTGADSVETLAATSITTSYADYEFTWSSPIAVSNGTRYWLVLFISAFGDNSNYVQWAGNPSGTESQWGNNSSVWSQVQASMDGSLTLYKTP